MTDAAPVRANRRPPLPSLTGLRWAFVMLVLGLHVRNFGYFSGQAGATVSWAFGTGGVGVSFFFVLSGFVLAWSTPPDDSSWAFWRRRFARIYPLHLVTAVAAIILGITIAPWLRSGLDGTIANLLLVHSWRFEWWQTLDPVTWSLACEAFFYLLFPAIHAAVRRTPPGALSAVAAGTVAVTFAIPWANLHDGWGIHTYSWPPARLPEFVLGVATAHLVMLGRWRGPSPDVAMAITVVGYFYAAQVPADYGFAACTLPGIGLLIPALALSDLRGERSPWRHPTMVRLGEVSYAFYLVHLLVMHVAARRLGFAPQLAPAAGLGLTGTVLVVSTALAWALHEAVENPARAYLTRPHIAGPASPGGTKIHSWTRPWR
jgi:peptidoglycan/LPS O-acetylase OafA/YrhL